jgi:general secretion pathway protein D
VFLLRRNALFGLLALALATSAAAQGTMPPPPPLPRPFFPNGPGGPAGPGSPASVIPAVSSVTAAPAAPERADVKLQFPNTQVTEVLGYYEMLTGKRVLWDPTVQGQVNIVVNTPVTKSEAITIIEVALTLDGFSLVPDGPDIIKVLGISKNVRSSGVPIYFDLAQVPYSEESISFLVRLRYLDAQEVASLLQQYIPPGQSTGVTALQKSGALLITDSANSVRRLVNMVNQIDLPVAPVTEKFIRLERADATKAVEFLDSVFDIKGSQNGAGGGAANSAAARRPIRRLNDDGQLVNDSPPGTPNQILPGQLPLLSGDSIIQGRITLTADVRTNRVHVVTSPLNMPLVEQLISDYDADAPFAEPVRYPLHFVKAKDILPILVQSLTEPGTETNPTNATGNTPKQPTAPAHNTGSTGSSGENGSGSGSESGDSTVGQEELTVEPADTIPQIETVGNTKIIADPSSNTIILLGGAEAKDKVLKILNTLDIRKRQIIIRVVIGELSLENDSEFGLQYLIRHGQKGFLASQYQSGFLPTSSATTTTDPTTGVTTTSPATTTPTNTVTDLTALASGLPSGFTGLAGIISITKNFDVILSALQATTRFKTINNPVIFTSNSEKATIISGEEIAVPTSSLSTATLGSTSTTTGTAAISSNVDFKKVALQLEVVPLINSDKEVTLDIVQKLDSLVAGASVTVGGNVIPTIANREIKSTVSMQSGATVVLGGLITESDDKTNNDVPYLSKIPYLGPIFFRSTTHTIMRSELIILLHPEVVNTPDAILASSVGEQNRTYLGTNLENELLPNMPVRKALPVNGTTTTTTITTVRAPGTPAPK